MNSETLTLILVVIALFITALNSVLVLVIWSRHERLRDRAEAFSMRLSTTETKLTDLADIKRQLHDHAQLLAALDERTESMQGMVATIQNFLVNNTQRSGSR